MKLIHENAKHVLGAYVCPDNFVSQVVYFSQKPDLNWFNKTIADQVGAENFTTNDVRTATRHGWELGGGAHRSLQSELGPDSTLTEVYWTRYPRTENQEKVAISVCVGDGSRAGCLKLFAHDKDKIERLCVNCRGR